MTGKVLCGLFMALMLLSLLGACEDVKAEIITIVDGRGQSVDVPAPVERIASISSRASEIICALGAGDKINGRDSYSYFPPDLEDVQVVAESSYTPNVELIHELDPDLVIADSMLSALVGFATILNAAKTIPLTFTCENEDDRIKLEKFLKRYDLLCQSAS